MVFFQPDGHGLFLLGLCVAGPLLLAGLIFLLSAAGTLRHRGEVEQNQGGLAIALGDLPPKAGPLSPADETPALTKR